MAAFTRSTARKARETQKPRGPSKVATEFRQVVAQLLEKNVANVELWLAQVANGKAPSKRVPLGVAPDPARALDLIAKLAEYAAPKLQRTEVLPGAGLNGMTPITQIAITFVDGRAPSAPDPVPILETPTQALLEAIPAHHDPATMKRQRVASPGSKLVSD
jgi:hypothetical protein